MNEAHWLPLVFAGLMALAILIYAMLDGYDLGVGILLPSDSEVSRDQMISSIGPFWDANETWLVLAVGIMLIAFPSAHSIVLAELYLPAAFMLIGLILRGVAFDFRAKAVVTHRARWDTVFKAGSLIASLTQGYMLGMYVVGFADNMYAYIFACLSAVSVTAAYSYIGAAWLVMKTEGELQKRAAAWGRKSGWFFAIGVIAVCIVNPLANPAVFEKWFSLPNAIMLLPIPIVCTCLFIMVDQLLKKMPLESDFGCWIPFVSAVFIFFFCFQGLAYSFYPFVVPNQLTIWEAASAPESLRFILYGAVIVVPVILMYTLFLYRVFWGKTTDLKYY